MSGSVAGKIEVRVHRTIREIPADGWDACFPGDPECWAYYLAVEEAGLDAFSWAYLVAWSGDRVVAAVPAFITDYRLDTTIQGAARSALKPVLAVLRRALTLRLLSLGSPLADKCHLGFSGALPIARRYEVAGRLLEGLNAFASAQRIGLLAAKDVAESDLLEGVGEAFEAAGFARQPGLPNAVLALPESEAAYLASLPAAVRRDVRRKLKRPALVRVEERRGPAALELVPQVVALYEAQRERSGADFEQFEQLTPAYFRGVLEHVGEAAVLFIYRVGEQPVAFNLCYHTGRIFIDKFIGFSLPAARAHNLYVLSWMNNLRYCIARNIPVLQTGQTGYAMKTRMGSELRPNWIYFRHRNRLLNFFLRLAGPLLAADRHDEDLARVSRGAS